METLTVISLEQLLNGANVHRNLSVPQLLEAAIIRGEGVLTNTGALRVTTGKYTGRSPQDKFIVKDPSIAGKIAWGNVNQPFEPNNFMKLYHDVLDYLSGKELFVFDGYAGADDLYSLPLTVVNELAWHNLFAHQLFIRTLQKLPHRDKESSFTIVSAPGFKAIPSIHGTRSETFIILNYEKRIILIGGTEYAGEMKKGIFSVMNTILPEKNVLSMHCSANIGNQGDVALFFGLSGTGKTTLSADPNRRLIGDDEHGWSETGIFNIEGGCYAKCIHLSAESEPQIYNSVRYGAVLENVPLNGDRQPDYHDACLTENTRAAYPIEHMDNAVIPSTAGHPGVILFLTGDAFGVLPPIAKLTKQQAMYHFLSGYTSKLAGTERGVTKPEATFSTCFGAPFLPLRASVYAKLLGEKIDEHHTNVYLVNTGWSGGPYGVGKRMNLSLTRKLITAAITGELEKFNFHPDPIFGLLIPEVCPGVSANVLNPRDTWADKDAYDQLAIQLLHRFNLNFETLENNDPAVKEIFGE